MKTRPLSSLSNPTYRLYFFGTLGQFAAMTMQMVTGPLLIYRLTESSVLLGTVSLVSAFPMIIMSLFGGAVSDRIQKKHILIFSLLCYAAVSLIIALFLETGIISREVAGSWRILMVCSFFQGACMGILMPSIQAILAEIVNKDQLMNATALNMLGMNFINLAVPSIAGFMIQAFGFAVAYYTMAGLYLYVAIFILFLPGNSRIATRGASIFLDIQKGFSYAQRDSIILVILVFTTVAVVLSMPYQQLLPIFVDNILKVGAVGMGILISASGVGALVASLTLSFLPNKKRGIMLLTSGLVSGLALVSFAFSSSWYLSLVFIGFVGLGHATRNTIGSALLQVHTEIGYMGRVMSLFNLQFGLMSIFTFMAGVLAGRMPVQWVLGGMAGTLFLFCLLCIVFFSRIRRLD